MKVQVFCCCCCCFAPLSGPSAHTGQPTALQTGYLGPQSAYPGPQLGYTVSTAGSEGYNATQLPIQNSQAVILVNTQWMPAPPPLQNCPPGLEYLSQVNSHTQHSQKTKLYFYFYRAWTANG